MNELEEVYEELPEHFYRLSDSEVSDLFYQIENGVVRDDPEAVEVWTL